LRRARAAYNDEDYWDAVSHLQQADEKIAKALLLGLGFLPDSEDLRSAMKRVFGVKKTKPEDLGHDWHANFIGDLDPFLRSFEEVTKSLEKGKSEQSKAAVKWWKNSIPDYKERVKKAKAVKPNPIPSAEELNGIIADCNKALDLIIAAPDTVKVGDLNLPKIDEIDESLKVVLKGYGVNLDEESRKSVESKALAKFSRIISDFNGIIVSATQSSFLLVELAVLNVVLSRHHILANYPTNKVVYDKKLPLIERFENLHSLLRRSLDLARHCLATSS
jgi:hypothetical protein